MRAESGQSGHTGEDAQQREREFREERKRERAGGQGWGGGVMMRLIQIEHVCLVLVDKVPIYQSTNLRKCQYLHQVNQNLQFKSTCVFFKLAVADRNNCVNSILGLKGPISGSFVYPLLNYQPLCSPEPKVCPFTSLFSDQKCGPLFLSEKI